MEEFLKFQNLVFLAPLVIGTVVFLVMSAFAGFDHGELHADIHADIHADLDHDVDIDHDLTHDVHESPSGGSIASLLGFFGFGRIPLNLVLLSWAIIWGTSGYALNILLGYSWFILNLIIAGLLTILGTRKIAGLAARFMPGFESYVQSGYHFLGREGIVRFTIRGDCGTVRLTDSYGDLQELSCRLREGQETIPVGSRVQIDDYDEATHSFRVKVVNEGSVK